jgi:ATP-dependent Clp protease adaptor protein ClpS
LSETLTPPRERLDRGEGTGSAGPWLVIVLNDDHNTFQGVAAALSAVVPGVSYDDGMRMANRIHNSGQASSGPASASRPSSTGSSCASMG